MDIERLVSVPDNGLPVGGLLQASHLFWSVFSVSQGFLSLHAKPEYCLKPECIEAGKSVFHPVSSYNYGTLGSGRENRWYF